MMKNFKKIKKNTTDKIHSWLLERLSWYGQWHQHSHHEKIHWTAFGIYLAIIFGLIYSSLPVNTKASAPVTFRASFDRGTLNADYAAGDKTAYDDDSSASLVSPGFGSSSAASLGYDSTLRYKTLNNLNPLAGEIEFSFKSKLAASPHNSSGYDNMMTDIAYDPINDYVFTLGEEGIVRMKLDGSEWTTYGSDGDKVGQFRSFGYGSLDYDPQTEFFYISDMLNCRIIKTKIDGTGWQELGSPGTGIGQFNMPQGIDYDPATDYIYIADYGSHRIVKTKIDGTGWTTLGGPSYGSTIGKFRNPRDVVVDSISNSVFVTDTGNQRVVKTQMDSTGWQTYGSAGAGDGQFNNPVGIAYDEATDHLIIADLGNLRIVKTKIDGTDWTTLSKDPVTGENILGPMGIAFDSSTSFIYTFQVSGFYRKIFKTKIDGTGWTSMSAPTNSGELTAPYNLDYDSETGFLYIAETESNRIVKSRFDGTDWQVLDSNSAQTDFFVRPTDVVYDRSSGYLYISDDGNNRIVKTKIDGTEWTTLSSNSLGTDSLLVASGLAYDSINDFVYIADGDRIVKTKMDGTEWTILSSNSLGTDSFSGAYDIEVDPVSGFLIISDSGNKRIVKTKMDGSEWTALSGNLDNTFSSPLGIDYDANTGFIYTADQPGRIIKSRIDGTGWELLSPEGSFGFVTGIVYDSNSQQLYATDVMSNAIVKLKSDGTKPEYFYGLVRSTLFATNSSTPMKAYIDYYSSRISFYPSVGGLPYRVQTAPLLFDANTWHTVKFSYDGSNGTLAIYVDNELAVTQTFNPFESLDLGNSFYLGCEYSNNYYTLSGQIDSVKITSYNSDITPPSNPTLSSAVNSSDNSTLISDNWYKHPNPKFTWSSSDNGSGIRDYLVYFGTDQNADPMVDATTTINHNPEVSPSYIPTNLVSGTYYLRVRTRDNANNLSEATTLFEYRYDIENPSPPATIVVDPAGSTKEKSYIFTWPANAQEGAALDIGGSGLAGYQIGYVGSNNNISSLTWSSTIPSSENSYTLVLGDNEHDFVGTNTFYLRAVDNAGNASNSTRVNFIHDISVSAPRNLTVSPTTSSNNPSMDNNFTFDWDEPFSSGIGGYYYWVNTPIKESNMREVRSDEGTSIGPDHFATLQDKNTLYIMANNGDATDIKKCDPTQNPKTFDPSICATIDFYVNTPAPEPPQLLQLYDISNRDSNEYAVVLKWQEPANKGTGFEGYSIYRSIDAGPSEEVGNTTGSTTFINDNLSNEHTYSYTVKSREINQESAVSESVMITPTGKYSIPPDLKKDSIRAVPKAFSANITWETERSGSKEKKAGKSSSIISFSPDKNGIGDNTKAKTIADPDKDESHSVTLTGLEPSTKYYYQAIWEDVDGNQGKSEILNFTTKEKPELTNVTTNNITLNSATISWQSKNVINSEITYCSPSGCQKKNILSLANQLVHTLQLADLSHSTEYQYKIQSVDIDGNTITSDKFSFSTLTMPQINSEPKIDQDKTSATTTYRLSWTTNVDTTTIVNYHPEGEKPLSQSKADYVQTHEIVIPNLSDQSIYTFELTGVDSHGNKVETPFTTTITTPQDSRPPKVTNMTVEVKSNGFGSSQKAQLVVTWETDEPATSQIEYSEGISGKDYNFKTREDGTYSTSHVVIASELEPSKIYHLRAASKDKAGNSANSDDTTTITGKVQQSVVDLIINSLQKSLGWIFGGFK